MGKKTALITGISGQTGSYMADLLLDMDYEVHGIIRRAAVPNLKNLSHIEPDKLNLHYGDLTDAPSLIRIVRDVAPDEIYHLGAMSFVKSSFDNPSYTLDVNGSGTLSMLEATRFLMESGKDVRFFHSATSEMFGDVHESPQTEDTPLNPQSPYGCSKVYAYHQVQNYRKAYNLFATNGIAFNHESARRGPEFVTRKITLGACSIKLGLQSRLVMGNMSAYRDWGYAPDYVEGYWRSLQVDQPDDYIFATNNTHTIQEFADLAFRELGLDSSDYIDVDPKFYRPSEVNLLMGDYSKANKLLGWAPKVQLPELVALMVDSDFKEMSSLENNN